tara:strand:- start:145 stop:489 length:345 start_codon:yes stop_codon:yes gene_type:complete
MDLEKYKQKIKEFSDDRNWDQYHTPKNLAMALSVEVSELVEIFQWMKQDESKNLSLEDVQSVKEELADIFIYLIRIADKFDIKLEEAVIEKINKNAEKYPIELAKDNAIKYNKR